MEDPVPAEYKPSYSKNSMSKKLFLFFVVLVVVVVALGIWIGLAISGSGAMSSASNPDGPSPYSAVYLATGDIYFGKLSWFPSPHLTDVWYLTRSQDQSGQTQLGVAPFKSVSWGPVDEINLDTKQIVFWTALSNGSQMVQAIEGTASAPAGVQPQSGTSPTDTPPSAPSSSPSAPSGK